MLDSEPDPRCATKSGVAFALIKVPRMGQNTDIPGEGSWAQKEKWGHSAMTQRRQSHERTASDKAS